MIARAYQNGVFYFNETEKPDRKAVTEKMISLLQEEKALAIAELRDILKSDII